MSIPLVLTEWNSLHAKVFTKMCPDLKEIKLSFWISNWHMFDFIASRFFTYLGVSATIIGTIFVLSSFGNYLFGLNLENIGYLKIFFANIILKEFEVLEFSILVLSILVGGLIVYGFFLLRRKKKFSKN